MTATSCLAERRIGILTKKEPGRVSSTRGDAYSPKNAALSSMISAVRSSLITISICIKNLHMTSQSMGSKMIAHVRPVSAT